MSTRISKDLIAIIEESQSELDLQEHDQSLIDEMSDISSVVPLSRVVEAQHS